MVDRLNYKKVLSLTIKEKSIKSVQLFELYVQTNMYALDQPSKDDVNFED